MSRIAVFALLALVGCLHASSLAGKPPATDARGFYPRVISGIQRSMLPGVGAAFGYRGASDLELEIFYLTATLDHPSYLEDNPFVKESAAFSHSQLGIQAASRIGWSFFLVYGLSLRQTDVQLSTATFAAGQEATYKDSLSMTAAQIGLGHRLTFANALVVGFDWFKVALPLLRVAKASEEHRKDAATAQTSTLDDGRAKARKWLKGIPLDVATLTLAWIF